MSEASKPEPKTKDDSQLTGMLAWFARNQVAANLLMVLLLGGGYALFASMPVEVFPEIDPGVIKVTVPYPGATPGEVEEGICRRIEEAISGIEGIKRIQSSASEGSGIVTAELTDQADDREVLDDIEAAVSQIADFPPEDAEEVRIVDQDQVETVLRLALHGPADERTLRELAFQVRDQVTALESVTIAEVAGVRRYELSIEVREDDLQRHGLTFEQVSQQVSRFSLDLPGGAIRSSGGDILLRTLGQAYTAHEFEDLVVSSRADGTVLRLRDVADVIDGFEDVDRANLFEGEPAVFVDVNRVGDQRVLDIEEEVMGLLDTVSLPEGVGITVADNGAEALRSRVNLLARNGLMGLVLVFGCLVLFLDLRLAFWTTMGIPIAFLGSTVVIALFDGSVNMISLFAFIIVLGLVVDDAIVVGESIFSKLEAGLSPLRAAVEGTREVLVPVTIAVLTTMIAFLPLYFTPGFFGDILWVVPIVVIGVLTMSLVEALLILPAHLGSPHERSRNGIMSTLQERLRAGLGWLIDRFYLPTLRRALDWRYLSVALMLAVVAISGGAIRGGQVRAVLFPPIDGDDVRANLTMARDAPASETERGVHQLLEAAERVRTQVDAEHAPEGGSMFKHVSASIGTGIRPGGPHGGSSPTGTHVGSVTLALVEAEDRAISAAAVEALWREEVGEVAGASALAFRSGLLTAGDDVSVEMAHADFDKLLTAVERLKTELASYEGVSDIDDSFVPGKRELRFGLTDAGLAAGLTLADLGRQLRQAFQGLEAQRVQRGRDDVRVLVRYSEAERQRLGTLADMRIRLSDGREVPLSTVATVEEARGYASIERADRRRIVTVLAKVDDLVVAPTEVNADLRDRVLPALVRDFPGLTFSFEGAQRERNESLFGLAKLLGVALLAMYALLAAQLKSYVQPLVIMSAIPAGAVGAMIAHGILGVPLSFFSAFGLVALAGVVVNDSLVLMDLANRRRAEGLSALQAVLAAGPRRFRPILFTSLTTCLGLAPMISEKSVQAQFLIPVAISLAGGVAFATVVTLVVVPCLYCIADDLGRGRARLADWLAGTGRDETVADAPAEA
ncbi:MAG: efflux RND transporter permease subunit [Acidobacteriota bacterium]